MHKIYQITNLVNGKKYIGMTKFTPAYRFGQHVTLAENGSNLALHRAIRKYGVDQFIVELIAEFKDRGECAAREVLEIDAQNTIIEGYNMIPGGYVSSGMRGKKHSPQTKEILSQLRRGKKRPEHSKIMKEIFDTKIRPHLLKTGEDHPQFGVMHSSETKHKLRMANTGRFVTQETIAKREATKAKKKTEGFRQRRLNEEQVRLIRRLRADGMTISAIRTAIDNQVSLAAIKDVLAGRTYSQIT